MPKGGYQAINSAADVERASGIRFVVGSTRRDHQQTSDSSQSLLLPTPEKAPASRHTRCRIILAGPDEPATPAPYGTTYPSTSLSLAAAEEKGELLMRQGSVMAKRVESCFGKIHAWTEHHQKLVKALCGQ